MGVKGGLLNYKQYNNEYQALYIFILVLLLMWVLKHYEAGEEIKNIGQ